MSKKVTQKDLTRKRVELKKQIKKLETELESITPKKKRSKSYGRTKGLSFERDTANKLKHLFPEVRRQLEFQIQDAKGIDLQNTGDFKIQCKKYAGYVSISTINEVRCNEEAGEMPILVTAGTNLEAMVVMKFEQWVELLNRLYL